MTNTIVSNFFKDYKEKTGTDLQFWYDKFLLQQNFDTSDHVLDVACEVFDVSKAHLKTACRKREFVNARLAASYFLRKKNLSLKTIGLTMGGRDHSTIIYHIKLFNDNYLFDRDFKKKADQVSMLLKIQI